MNKVTIFTDGAAVPNPGSGGAGVVMVCGKHVKRFGIYLGENITNNAAEIGAVIAGFEALKYPCEVEVVSDSQYVISTMSKGWSRGKNLDLWHKLDQVSKLHKVTWTWQRGHVGHEWNEAAHELANEAVRLRRNVYP